MKKHKILVFSSDPSVISPLKESFDIEGASNHREFIKKVEANPGLLAAIDCDTRNANGLSLFREIKKLSPASAVIMLSSDATIPEAVEASKIGVADFIRKPALNERLIGSVKNNLPRWDEAEIKLPSRPAEWMLGGGSRIKAMFSQMELALKERKNILFISEDGIDVLSLVKIMRDRSGAIQKLSTVDMLAFRKEGIENIFWMVLQEALTSSDIIYFERFNAAERTQRANILDFIRKKGPKGNITVMAGVNNSEGSAEFSEWDKVMVPALRQRKEDLPDMLVAYIDSYSAKYGRKIENIALDAFKMINDYSWPGNYRELECAIENAVIANEGGTITLGDLRLGSKMLEENLRSSQSENLLDFKNGVEKGLVDIFLKKAASEDMAANLLDMPRSRITEVLEG